MRQAGYLAVIVLASLAPQAAKAQVQAVEPERRLGILLDRFREQAWTYRQELEFFQRAPEYQQLVGLRYDLRNKAIRVVQLEQAGQSGAPEQRQLAKEMEQFARELYRLTRQLEGRADSGARQEVRSHADSLTEQAVEMRVLIGRLHEALRMDYRGGQQPRPADGR